MTKTEMALALSKDFKSKQDARDAVDAVYKGIKENLVNVGDSVYIPGVGTLKVVRRPERKGRNPRTGAEIMIPAHNAIRFTQSKSKA